MLSPIITFIGYGIIAKYSSSKAPSAATIFSSLSLLSVLISRVNELVSAIPNLASALECCNRIQQYTEGKNQVDFRNPTREPRVSDIETDGETKYKISESGTGMTGLRKVNAGWSPEKTVLHDLCADFCGHTNDRCRAHWMWEIRITPDLARRRDSAQRLSKPVDRCYCIL